MNKMRGKLFIMVCLAFGFNPFYRVYAQGGDTESVDTVLAVERKEEGVKAGIRELIRESRKQGKGGSGGFFIGVAAFDSKPIKDFISGDHELSSYDFNIDERYQSALIKGMKGVVGLGKGRRIGFETLKSSKFFSSSAVNDTVLVIDLNMRSGGILFEKAFVRGDFNFLTGGLIGVGKIRAARKLFDSGKTVFDSDPEDKVTLTSNYYKFNVHAGFTWSFLSLAHLGTNLSVPLIFSDSGFEYLTDGYLSVNPRVDISIIIGNLG